MHVYACIHRYACMYVCMYRETEGSGVDLSMKQSTLRSRMVEDKTCVDYVCMHECMYFMYCM